MLGAWGPELTTVACGQLEFVGVKQDYLQMHKPQNLKQSGRGQGPDGGRKGQATNTSKKNNFHTISREENCPDRRQQQQQNKCEQSQKVDKGNSNNKKNNKGKHNGISNK